MDVFVKLDSDIVVDQTINLIFIDHINNQIYIDIIVMNYSTIIIN